MIGFRVRQAALRLLDELLCRGFIRARRSDRGGAGFCRRQRLIVDLLGDLAFIHKKFVAMQIVLGLNVVGLRLFHLGMRGSQLSFRSDDAGLSVFNIGGGGFQLAGGVYRCDRHGNIQRLRRCFSARQICLCLRNRDFIVLRVDLYQHGTLLHPLVIVYIHFDHVTGDARADG